MNTHSFWPTLKRLVKDDRGFWLCLLTLSVAYLAFCFHEVAIHGWHAFYFEWLPYLAASPIVIAIKWLDEHVKLPLTVVEVLAKFIIAFNIAYMITPNLLTTPYPFVDGSLLHIDQWMHVDSIALLHFAALHPIFKMLLVFSYTYMSAAFMLLIFFFGLMGEKKRVNEIIIMTMIALFAASLAFYFFPAFGPETVLHSKLFPGYSGIEVHELREVQHNISPLGSHYFAGFVSIPSIHCFIASIGIYAIMTCKKYRAFLIPLVVIDALIIVSTMFLGEHYFIDLIAAELLLAAIVVGYRLVERLTQKQAAKNNGPTTCQALSLSGREC